MSDLLYQVSRERYTMSNPTAHELSLLRHACGPDRNYFAADDGSDDDGCWQQLVSKGLAKYVKKPSVMLPYKWYVVTDKGKEHL